MAFKKVKSKHVRLEVDIETLTEDGAYEKESFHAIFNRPTNSQSKSIKERLKSKDDQPSDEEVVETYLSGWEGVEDANGNEVKFTKKSLSEMLEDSDFCAAVSVTFLQLILPKKAFELILKGNL